MRAVPRSWAGRSLGALALLAAVALGAGFAALRDRPGRDATGERRIARNGEFEIHYFAAGSARGEPVVLLPSFGRSVSDLNELARALGSAGFRTLAVQPRGIDGSSPPSRRETLHDYAADVAAVVAAERMAPRVSLVGHAYGNRIARTYASDHPDRVRKLVLLGAGGEVPPPPAHARDVMRALFGLPTASAREAAIRRAFFAPRSEIPGYWIDGWYPRAALAQSAAMPATPVAEWAGGGSAPILVIEGADDRLAPQAGESLRARFPERVRLEIVADAGHALLPEQPQRVAELVLAYLGAPR